MRSDTGFRRTRLIVTKLIRLTVETGSVTGMCSVSSNVLTRITPPTFSCCRSAQPYPFLWVPSSDFLRDTSPHHAQAVCKYRLHGIEFANPNYRWTGYLYIFD